MKIKVTKSKTLQSWLLTQISVFLDASASLAPAPVSSLVSRLVYILYIIQGCCLTSKVGWYTYCVRAERIVFWWPNTNTNIIRLPKKDRIRIRILFGFSKMTEYEYEYYSIFQKWPNTNTNIIRFPKKERIRIRILFDFPKMTEYESYLREGLWSTARSPTQPNPGNLSQCTSGPNKVDRGLSVPAIAEYFVTNNSIIVKSGDLRTQATQISGSECYLR